jgi:hypothetical protein
LLRLPECIIILLGYALNSTDPNMLWLIKFSFVRTWRWCSGLDRGFASASADDLSPRNWVNTNRLLDQSIEQLAAGSRFPAVKAKSEFIKVVVQLMSPDSSLVGTQQPPFQQRDSQMRDHQFLGLDYNMVEPISCNRAVSQPAICAHLASRGDVFFKERPKSISGSIRNPRQPDAPHTFRLSCKNRNILDGDCYEHFVICTTAPLARSFATDVSFVNLHDPHQAFAFRTYHCASESVKPLPSCVVAAKPQNSLQTERVRSIFLVGNMPHRFKPHSQRLSSLMENSPRSNRNLAPTILTQEQAARHFPSAASAAFDASEPIRPSEGGQVCGASFFRGKAVPEFRQIARVVFHTRILHVGGG